MQPFSPSSAIALVASAEKRAVSPVANPQAVVRVVRPVRGVASATVGSRRGAAVAGFCKRGIRGARAASPVPPSSPNPALNLAPSGRWTALKRRRLALR